MVAQLVLQSSTASFPQNLQPARKLLEDIEPKIPAIGFRFTERALRRLRRGLCAVTGPELNALACTYGAGQW